MSDRDLRTLERQARASGDPESVARLARAQDRAGIEVRVPRILVGFARPFGQWPSRRKKKPDKLHLVSVDVVSLERDLWRGGRDDRLILPESVCGRELRGRWSWRQFDPTGEETVKSAGSFESNCKTCWARAIRGSLDLVELWAWQVAWSQGVHQHAYHGDGVSPRGVEGALRHVEQELAKAGRFVKLWRP